MKGSYVVKEFVVDHRYNFGEINSTRYQTTRCNCTRYYTKYDNLKHPTAISINFSWNSKTPVSQHTIMTQLHDPPLVPTQLLGLGAAHPHRTSQLRYALGHWDRIVGVLEVSQAPRGGSDHWTCSYNFVFRWFLTHLNRSGVFTLPWWTVISKDGNRIRNSEKAGL